MKALHRSQSVLTPLTEEASPVVLKELAGRPGRPCVRSLIVVERTSSAAADPEPPSVACHLSHRPPAGDDLRPAHSRALGRDARWADDRDHDKAP